MGSNDAQVPEQAVIPAKVTPRVDYSKSFQTRIGLTADDLRKKLEFKEPGIRPGNETPIGKFLLHIAAKVREARTRSLQNWKLWAALDDAWGASLKQVNPILIQKIMSGDKLNVKELMQQFTEWNLPIDECFYTVKENGVEVRKLKKSAFHRVFIPLVKSVVTARCAKIYNDRFGNDPLFVYDPIPTTEEAEEMGQVVTRVIQQMTSAFGYRDVGRAMILQALKYTHCLMFPMESWHTDWEPDIGQSEGAYAKKEGIRYHLPHPTRMAWDQNHRASTFNSDSGCEWAAFWDIHRYGDVVTNTLFYNTRDVCFGTNWWDPALSLGGTSLIGAYFTSAYRCMVEKPVPITSGGTWTGNKEAEAALYTEADYDKAVFLTNLFLKIDPVQWGLVDKKTAPWSKMKGSCKVWFRFLMANDDTPIWAEPLVYCPVIYCGCDTDDTFTVSSSLALDALPWQTFASNIVSQYLLATKLNQKKIIPYDQDQVDSDKIAEIENTRDENEYMQWLPYSSKQAMVEQVDPSKMFTPIMLGQQPTTELVTCLNTLFSVMERTLRMSAQEVGAIAGHIQTAREIETIAGSTTSYVEFTASFTDSAIDAWKRQLWVASREYTDGKFAVTISKLSPEKAAKLKTLGWELTDMDDRTLVKGKVTDIPTEAFLSQREGTMRTNWPELAKVMMQTLQVMMNSPLGQRMGPEYFAKWMERAARMAGAPEDFDIKIPPEATSAAEMNAIGQQISEMAKQIVAQATQASVQQVNQEMTPALKEQQEAALELAKRVKAMEDALAQLMQMQQASIPPVPMPQPMPAVPMPIPAGTGSPMPEMPVTIT